MFLSIYLTKYLFHYCFFIFLLTFFCWFVNFPNYSWYLLSLNEFAVFTPFTLNLLDHMQHCLLLFIISLIICQYLLVFVTFSLSSFHNNFFLLYAWFSGFFLLVWYLFLMLISGLLQQINIESFFCEVLSIVVNHGFLVSVANKYALILRWPNM